MKMTFIDVSLKCILWGPSNERVNILPENDLAENRRQNAIRVQWRIYASSGLNVLALANVGDVAREKMRISHTTNHITALYLGCQFLLYHSYYGEISLWCTCHGAMSRSSFIDTIAEAFTIVRWQKK